MKKDKKVNAAKKKEEKIPIFRVIRRVVPMTFRVSPKQLVFLLIMSTLQGFFLFAIMPASKQFFSMLTDVAEKKSIALGTALASLAIFVGVKLADRLFNGVTNFYWNIAHGIIAGRLQRELNLKQARVEAVMYESTKFLDDVNRASGGLYTATYMTIMICSTFSLYLVYLSLTIWYLSSMSPLLIASVFIMFVPIMFSQLMRVKVQAKFEDEAAPLRRQYYYYESCITERLVYKETRLLGVFKYFRDMYVSILLLLQALELKSYVKNRLIDLLIQTVKLIGHFGVIGLLLHTLFTDQIGIGEFAAVYTSIGMLEGIMSELVEGHLSRMASYMGGVNNFVRLLDYPEREGKTEVPEGDRTVVLDKISFAYPTGEDAPEEVKYAVKDLSLTLYPGETVAVVGENGSGKSTLARLITGLYLPAAGSVFHNGVDTREIDPEVLYRETSAIVQRYARYQMTLKDNITVAQVGKTPDERELDECCASAGVERDSRSFPDGYDTMLSREFDGVDLSGGQWQRVAIARGIYRDSSLIVLDEPTAAIDPLEEKRIYDNFAKVAKGKTSILITHRLGSVRLADRIVMMKDGGILGVGTHGELMEGCPEYAELYHSQADLYV